MLTITTNNHPRELLSLAELTDSEREEFDYVTGEDQWSARFVRAYGNVYDVNEFSAHAGISRESGDAGRPGRVGRVHV